MIFNILVIALIFFRNCELHILVMIANIQEYVINDESFGRYVIRDFIRVNSE